MRPLVVLPTYDEAENLPELAARLLGTVPALDVLVVDDASPDGTAAIAEEIGSRDARMHVMRRPGPRGYGRSVADGLSWGIGSGFDPLVTMDADLSHDPSAVTGLLAGWRQGADVVVGSRYVAGGGLDAPNWGPVRLAVSRLGSWYARRMLGTKVRDCTSGFRCYRSSALERVDLAALRSEGYGFLIELLHRLTAEGARVEEVPITYVDRRAGRSKISRAIVLEALVRTTGIGVARLAARGRSTAAGDGASYS